MNQNTKLYRVYDKRFKEMVSSRKDFFFLTSDNKLWYDCDPKGQKMDGRKCAYQADDNLIVMMCCWITDINGDMIYDDDIIEFDSGKGNLIADSRAPGELFKMVDIHNGKIIGNVWENPELK